MKQFEDLRKWCKKIEIEIFDKWLISLDHVTYLYSLEYDRICTNKPCMGENNSSNGDWLMLCYAENEGTRIQALNNKTIQWYCYSLSLYMLCCMSLHIVCYWFNVWPQADIISIKPDTLLEQEGKSILAIPNKARCKRSLEKGQLPTMHHGKTLTSKSLHNMNITLELVKALQ